MHDFNASVFGIAHGSAHLFQRLLFLQSVENGLTAAFNTEHDGPTMGCGHGGKEMLRNGIYPSFDAPLNTQSCLHDPCADGLDAFGLQKKVIIDKINGPVPLGFKVCKFGDDMLRGTGAPFTFVKDRDVAEHTGPWTAP